MAEETCKTRKDLKISKNTVTLIEKRYIKKDKQVKIIETTAQLF